MASEDNFCEIESRCWEFFFDYHERCHSKLYLKENSVCSKIVPSRFFLMLWLNASS